MFFLRRCQPMLKWQRDHIVKKGIGLGTLRFAEATTDEKRVTIERIILYHRFHPVLFGEPLNELIAVKARHAKARWK